MGLSTRHGTILSALRSLLTVGPGLQVVAGGVDGVGADVFADAFLLSDGAPVDAARSALVVADRPLQGIRVRNRLSQFSFFIGPEAGRALTARLPRWAWQLFVDDWVRLGG